MRTIKKSDEGWYELQDGWDEQRIYFNLAGLKRLKEEIEAIIKAEEESQES